jgi:hypothetical protein
MPTVFGKLNLKDQKQILIVGAPQSFESEIATLKDLDIVRDLKKTKAIGFSLAFVTKQDQVDRIAPEIGKKAEGDAVVWFAYPKGSSKNYKSELNPDSRWKVMGQAGFEPVRMVAIDEDWTATRFRRAEFIKNMTRPEEYRLVKTPAKPARPK